VGDHLPRKCGIATFTSDLLAAVASAHPLSQCLAVSVNDIPGGYEYPEMVRFEIEEHDVLSYLRAADFLNISNVDIVCLLLHAGTGAHKRPRVIGLRWKLRFSRKKRRPRAPSEKHQRTAAGETLQANLNTIPASGRNQRYYPGKLRFARSAPC